MNLPIGSIILWAGGSIPSGWAVCNGSNGTPDLRSRFVRGATNNGQLKTTGGATTHVHSNGNTGSAGGHAHTGISGSSGNSGTEMYYGGSNEMAAGNHSHGLSGTPNSVANHSHTVGNTESASNLPPYKVLQFIMRIS